MSYAKLIINEEPLQLLPELAVAVGLNEAIVLQQLHYWMSPKKKQGKMADGRRWIKNSYTQWRDDNFPFWSEKVIGNIFRSLESKGVIDSRQDLNGDRFDQSKWYSINYGHPTLVPNGNIDDTHSGHSDYTHSGHSDSPDLDIVNKESENTTENTTENSSSDKSSDVGASVSTSAEELFEEFWKAYPKKVGKGAARTAFKRAIKKTDLATMVASVNLRSGTFDWTKDNGQYIPNPATWLNQERWEDANPSGGSISPSNRPQPQPSPDVDWSEPSPSLAWMLDPNAPKPWEGGQ